MTIHGKNGAIYLDDLSNAESFTTESFTITWNSSGIFTNPSAQKHVVLGGRGCIGCDCCGALSDQFLGGPYYCSQCFKGVRP